MEQGSKLYRCTIPIPVWIFYLYNAFGEEEEMVKIKGLAFSGVYPLLIQFPFIMDCLVFLSLWINTFISLLQTFVFWE